MNRLGLREEPAPQPKHTQFLSPKKGSHCRIRNYIQPLTGRNALPLCQGGGRRDLRFKSYRVCCGDRNKSITYKWQERNNSLQRLKEANEGVMFEGVMCEGVSTGSLAHADDLRSLTWDVHSSERQAAIINSFLTENFLQLNTEKCELIVYTYGEPLKNLNRCGPLPPNV